MKKYFSLFLITVIVLGNCTLSFASIVEDGVDPGKEKIVVNEDNSITFVYDESDKKLVDCWERSQKFTDITPGSPYQQYVTYLSSRGILKDSKDGFFYPDEDVTKEFFFEILYELCNQDAKDWIVNDTDINQDGVASEEYIENILYKLAEIEHNDLYISFRKEQDSLAEEYKNDDEMLSEIVCDQKKVITRGLLSKKLYLYVVLRDKPTLRFQNGTYISYDESKDSDITESEESYKDIDCSCDSCNANNGGNSPKWSGLSSPNVHKMITQKGFVILMNEQSGNITNLSGKYSSTARSNVYLGCSAPDEDAYNGNPDNAWKFHYFSPDGKNGAGKKKTDSNNELNAFLKWNNEYYLAVEYFKTGYYISAYRKLGRAMHYMEDITSPPHAALITNANSNNAHKNYESWVRDDDYGWNNYYYTSSAGTATYNYMSNTMFSDIAVNFSQFAYDRQSCVYNFTTNPSSARQQTKECLHKSQRAVAGLAYRYLADTNRLW